MSNATDKMTVHDVVGDSDNWPDHQRQHIECLLMLEALQEVAIAFSEGVAELLESNEDEDDIMARAKQLTVSLLNVHVDASATIDQSLRSMMDFDSRSGQ